MGPLWSWLMLSVAVWITATALPGFHVKNFKSAILVAAIFGVLNFFSQTQRHRGPTENHRGSFVF